MHTQFLCTHILIHSHRPNNKKCIYLSERRFIISLLVGPNLWLKNNDQFTPVQGISADEKKVGHAVMFGV